MTQLVTRRVKNDPDKKDLSPKLILDPRIWTLGTPSHSLRRELLIRLHNKEEDSLPTPLGLPYCLPLCRSLLAFASSVLVLLLMLFILIVVLNHLRWTLALLGTRAESNY